MCSGTSCCWYFHRRVNMRCATDADDPAPSLLPWCPGGPWEVDPELSAPAAVLLEEVLVPAVVPAPAPAAAAAPDLVRGTKSGMMLMAMLSAPAAGRGCCRPPTVLLLEAAWLAVLLLGRLAEPELRRPVGCRLCWSPWRGDLASSLRCAAACEATRQKQQSTRRPPVSTHYSHLAAAPHEVPVLSATVCFTMAGHPLLGACFGT